MSRKVLRVGIIGGGGKAFIAHAHRMALTMGGTAQIVCGALHENPDVAMQEAENWPHPIKGYPTYDAMIDAQYRPDNDNLDYILIVTPNNVHFDPAKKCLEAGIPVFCEKPLTMTTTEAEQLQRIVKIPFGVAHTYLGHWSSLFARWVVTSGKLGTVRRADAYYWQGWLSTRTEDTGLQQAEWRVDPNRAGISGCGGDIGTHAFMQFRFITGLEISEILFAKLTTFVSGRKLDDNFSTVCRANNGAEVHIRASQIMVGHKNDLGLEVNCEKGTLIWQQEEPEKVVIHLPGYPNLTYWRGDIKSPDPILGDIPSYLFEPPSNPTLPSGHGEAFHDAFHRLHLSFGEDVRLWQEGKKPIYAGERYASIHDGVMHMRFIEVAIQCAAQNTAVAL